MAWAILGMDQHAAIEELHNTKSDRVLAVLGGAFLDSSLRRTLEQRLRPVEKGKTDINDALFKPGGPLGNIVPKIQLAYQLYMFEKPARNAMTGIVEIRNLFAHHLNMTFADAHEGLKAADAKFRMHVGLKHYPSPFTDEPSDIPIDPSESLRDRFLVNLKLAQIILLADMRKHLAWSNISVGMTYPQGMQPTSPEKPDPPISPAPP